MGSSASKEVEELFTLHGPMVYGRALVLLGRKEDAEEALQEVFLRVMNGLDRFEHRSQISTWLYQITTNYCLNVLSQRSRRQRLLAQNVSPPEEQQEGMSAADLALLRQLLSEADEQQARAIVYVYLDCMPPEQAASVMGVSRGTVRNLIERFLTWAKQRSDGKKN